MTSERVRRKLSAILSADVKGYSRLMRDDEAATVKTLNTYLEIMTTLILQHHGRVVDSPGDNVLAEFASVVDTVQAAVAIQRELRVQNTKLPENRQMRFRIGINLGDVIVEGDRIYGDGVNIAARLEALAEPGGICISRTAYDQIEDKLPLGYEYLGEKIVKNIPKPIHAYRVLIEPGAISEKPERESVDERPREERAPRESIIEGHDGPAEKSKRLFANHLYIYLGAMGFLLIINVLTWAGVIWFHWPALGWGFMLFLHWRWPEFASRLVFPTSKEREKPISSKKRLPTVILCSLFGIFGAHRFYAGKIASGWVQLLTIGGLGIWYLIDFIIVIFGDFTDSEGKKIRKWI